METLSKEVRWAEHVACIGKKIDEGIQSFDG